MLLINVAGVAWVVRFQIVLALVLFASAVDFLVGPAVNRDRPELENLNSTLVKVDIFLSGGQFGIFF